MRSSRLPLKFADLASCSCRCDPPVQLLFDYVPKSSKLFTGSRGEFFLVTITIPEGRKRPFPEPAAEVESFTHYKAIRAFLT